MTTKEFTDDWKHFCNCINFDKSAMDADAIRFMNEGPGKIIQNIRQRDALLKIVQKIKDRFATTHPNGYYEIGYIEPEFAKEIEAAIANCKT